MHQNNCWLSVSLFCDQAQWHSLMKTGVLPYINKLFREKKLKSYHIQLNYSSGDNIRLPLLVAENEAEALASITDEYFKSYFLKGPLPKTKSSTRANGLFMPFPVNTIKYGLYNAEEPLSNILPDYVFQQQLSDLILESLATETVSDEAISMLSFFLYLSLFMIMWRDGRMDVDELMAIPFQLVSANKKLIDIGFIMQKFEMNKYVLFDITCDVMQQNDKEVAWCSEWTRMCERRIQEVEKSGGTVEDGYRQIADSIEKQLGLSESMKLAVFYFIREVTSV